MRLLGFLSRRAVLSLGLTTGTAVTQYLTTVVLFLALCQTDLITVTGGVAEVTVLNAGTATAHCNDCGSERGFTRSRVRIEKH